MKKLSIGDVGDRVIIAAGGYQDETGRRIDKDTPATVTALSILHYGRTGTYGVRPGTYRDPSRLTVETDDGRVATVNVGYLVRADGQDLSSVDSDLLWVSELPETDFWEMDTVCDSKGTYEVTGISFDMIGQLTQHGKPMPMYDLRDARGGRTYRAAEELELVERGPVWRRAHGETLSFPNITSEFGL